MCQSVPARVELPAEVKIGLAGLTVLGALLSCADPEAWASMARPLAADLGLVVQDFTDRTLRGLSAAGFALPEG